MDGSFSYGGEFESPGWKSDEVCCSASGRNAAAKFTNRKSTTAYSDQAAHQMAEIFQSGIVPHFSIPGTYRKTDGRLYRMLGFDELENMLQRRHGLVELSIRWTVRSSISNCDQHFISISTAVMGFVSNVTKNQITALIHYLRADHTSHYAKLPKRRVSKNLGTLHSSSRRNGYGRQYLVFRVQTSSSTLGTHVLSVCSLIFRLTISECALSKHFWHQNIYDI